MKYIDAEKLIAEIDSRMEDCKLPNGKFPTTTNIVRYEELSCLRNLITSLQQDQPDGLDEEVKKYWNAHALDYRIGRVADLDFMLLCARHFAEWGAIHLNARKEE